MKTAYPPAGLSSAIQLESRAEANDQQPAGYGFGHGCELIMSTFVGKRTTYHTMGFPHTRQWNDMYYHGDGDGPTDCESCDAVFRKWR